MGLVVGVFIIPTHKPLRYPHHRPGEIDFNPQHHQHATATSRGLSWLSASRGQKTFSVHRSAAKIQQRQQQGWHEN